MLHRCNLVAAFLLLFVFRFITPAEAQLKINFPSKDGVNMTADWYPLDDHSPVILMCHQAGSSRGEFSEIGLRLNKFGFNGMAVDLRSGGEMNGTTNETAKEAARRKKPQSNLDAKQDIEAAIDFLYEKYHRKVIVFGSSYSASLALVLAKDNEHILGVAAFSPGEYFPEKDYVAKHVSGLTKPVFVTSSKAEADSVTDVVKDVMSAIKIQYIPRSQGDHGAKVLWSSKSSNQEYWIAFLSFLNRMKKEDTLAK